MSDEEWSDEDWDAEDDEYQGDLELTRGLSYLVIDTKDIMRNQASAIEMVSDRLGLTSSQAGTLLSRYSWNPSLVCQKVMDGRGVEDIMLSRCKSLISDGASITCRMCYMDYPGSELRALTCCHFFCKDCYSGYLEDRVLTAGIECIFSTCPDSSCEVIVGEDLFRELVSRSIFEKYRRFVVRSYVERRSTVKWCPSPGCEFAVECPKLQSRIILCKCGFAWCFMCGNEAHTPLTCEVLAKWKAKDSSFEGNSDWLLVNTKNCPGCHSPIQKNEGCMHMTCHCHHEFCWLCLGPWSEHGSETGGFYACNRYTSKLEHGDYKGEERKRLLAEQKVKRYEHYSTRFLEHYRSVKLAKAKRLQVLESIKNIEKMIPAVKTHELEFMEEAADLIIEARTGLTYSYALGYYIKSKAKLNFYEFLQGELEHSLELLDGQSNIDIASYLETTPTGAVVLSSEFYVMRSKLIDISNIVKTHFSKSIKEMELGFPDISDSGTEDFLFEDVDDNINKSGYWTCQMCTLGNHLEDTTCQACGANRPS